MRTRAPARAAILFMQVPVNAQTLEQQEMRSLPAKKYFEESNAEWDRDSKKPSAVPTKELLRTQDYQSHFNTKLGKCLALLTRTVMYDFQNSANQSTTTAFSIFRRWTVPLSPICHRKDSCSDSRLQARPFGRVVEQRPATWTLAQAASWSDRWRADAASFQSLGNGWLHGPSPSQR